MSLNTSTPSTAITNSFFTRNALQLVNGGPDFEVVVDANGHPIFDENEDFTQAFTDAYHDYASLGVVAGATSGGGTKSIIKTAMDSLTGSSAANATTLGTAFANYWSTVAVTPGTPAHGGTSVVSVTNNAASLASAFTAAILNTATSSQSSPYYKTFLDNIETVVLTIQYTVTEVIGPPPGPTAFTETIS